MNNTKQPMSFARQPAMKVGKANRCVIKTVNPENIFSLPEGIVGFESIKEYCILLNDKVKPFLFLHALDDSNLCFVCIETFLVCPDFSVLIPDKTIDLLNLEQPSEALILSLVTVRKNVEEITANLMSPIVINMTNSIGQQVIVENSSYPVRFRIWDNLESCLAGTNAG